MKWLIQWRDKRRQKKINKFFRSQGPLAYDAKGWVLESFEKVNGIPFDIYDHLHRTAVTLGLLEAKRLWFRDRMKSLNDALRNNVTSKP